MRLRCGWSKAENDGLQVGSPSFFVRKQTYKPCSVLTAIYLDLPLPVSSSHLLGTAGQATCSPTVLLRIEFTGPIRSRSAGELLPHLSTLTGVEAGGISLLHLS